MTFSFFLSYSCTAFKTSVDTVNVYRLIVMDLAEVVAICRVGIQEFVN